MEALPFGRAPNDRIEYANHAVFLDRFPTVNSFLATYFVNRGQTEARWELKPHALRPFYRSLSDWCIFMSDPKVYGWKDNTTTIPPINVTIHEVPMTEDQKNWIHTELGTLIATRAGGITKRAAYGQVAKGFWKGKTFATNKPGYIADLVNGWRQDESTLVWCLYDKEQASVLASSAEKPTRLLAKARFLDLASICKSQPAKYSAGAKTATSLTINASSARTASAAPSRSTSTFQ